MAPYLTRHHSSSNSGKVRSKRKDTTSEVTSKTKGVSDKTSRTNVSTKVTNTRSNAVARKTRSSKDNGSILQSSLQKEKRKRVGIRKSTKKDNGNEVKLDEIAKDSGANKEKSKVKTRLGKPRKIVSNSKQMSLKESFLNQSKRKFVTFRNNSKNDKSEVKKKKLPIYRHLSPESSRQSTSEVYEFKFDVNDSKERSKKKRKKRMPNKATLINRKKRNIAAKRNLQEAKANAKKETAGKIEENKRADSIEPETKNSAESSSENKNSTEPLMGNKNSAEPLAETENSVGPLIENEKDTVAGDLIENVKVDAEAKDAKDSENTRKEQTARGAVEKPTITLVESLKARVSILDSSQASNADNFKPFRPTNIFANRLTVHQKHALNHSLFEQSFSPVKKMLENPQISSPWRASPLLTFSQVKNVFQSTPQNKYDIVGKKFPRPLNNDPKPFGSILKVKSTLQKNDENMSPECRAINTTPKKKNPLTSRKFGTEITNIDHSLQSKSPAEQNIERVSTETESIQPYVQSDSSENKRSNGSSPRKTPRKKVILVTAEVHQESTSQSDGQKENLNPQPGPSGLQTRPPLNEQRVLRQSNLNHFLNIPEMPQSSAIVTSHGIFDDTRSTPVTFASTKPTRQSNIELKNAFGFNDDDFNQEVSPNEKAIQTDIEPYDRKSVKRISVGQIRNMLLVKQPKEDAYNKENVITEKKEARKSPVKRRKQPLIDLSNFSDTFDLQSEADETSIASESNFPLFADHEPSYFTQPPRYSYKRKRAVRFSFSEGDSEEEDQLAFEHEIKRKRTNKLKMEQEKRAKEWVKNINRTFDEIDEHELLIE